MGLLDEVLNAVGGAAGSFEGERRDRADPPAPRRQGHAERSAPGGRAARLDLGVPEGVTAVNAGGTGGWSRAKDG